MSPSWFRKCRLDLLLVLPFLVVFYLQLAHHQLWRDETNVWALAVSSRTFSDLIHFARNEAHPYLWYVLVWIVSRGTVSLVALKWIAAAVGTCTYLFVALYSPFSRLEKVLLFCSYYLSFEYAVFARMYGLMLLLVLLYLGSRTSHPHKFRRNFVWLGLIANVDTFGMLLTFALALEYVWFLKCDPDGWTLRRRKQMLYALAVYLLFLAVSFASLIPTKHVSIGTSKGGAFAHVHDLTYVTRSIRLVMLDSWFPVDPRAPGSYWNVVHTRHITDAFLALVTVAVVLQFRRDQRLLFMLGFYALTLILFLYLVYMGFSRHYGTMFVAFLAALWIQRSRVASVPAGSSVSSRFALRGLNFALVPLGVCAWAGIVTAYASRTHPFSQAGATAQWLQANHYGNVPLAGTPDYSVANVAAHLGRPMYFLDCDCRDSFMQFSDRRDHFQESEIPSRLAKVLAQSHQPLLIYIGIRALTPEGLHELGDASLQATPLVRFTGAEEEQENYFLYKINAVAQGN